MATAHRRINVTCDPELAAALDATRDVLGELPDSARVRALALEGAKALVAGTPAEEVMRARRELLSRPGVRPATDRTRDFSWLEGEEVDHRHSATETLEWVRGPR
jgi:hypothetical protein